MRRDDLLLIYNHLNGKKIEATKGEKKLDAPKQNEVDITDNIFNTILDTAEMLKDNMMEESLKESFRNELEKLAEYYVEEDVDGNIVPPILKIEDIGVTKEEYDNLLKTFDRIDERYGLYL